MNFDDEVMKCELMAGKAKLVTTNLPLVALDVPCLERLGINIEDVFAGKYKLYAQPDNGHTYEFVPLGI